MERERSWRREKRRGSRDLTVIVMQIRCNRWEWARLRHLHLFVMRFAILLIESFFTFQSGFVYIYTRKCGIFEAWTSLLNSGKKINTKTRNNEWYVVSGWRKGKERQREREKQKNAIAQRGKREMINNSMDSMDKLGKLGRKTGGEF